MKRLIVYLVLLPLICGAPFLFAGWEASVAESLWNIYAILLLPALIVGLVDRFLTANSPMQGLACALAGFITVPAAGYVSMGALDLAANLYVGVIGAFAAGICWAL